MKFRPRILHCPLNTANHPWILSRAERNLGLKSDLIVFKEHPFFRGNWDKNLKIEYLSIPNEIRRIGFLRWALKNYDIFHFNFGQTIIDHPFPGLSYLDLPILKKAGKKIIVLFQGDDIRDREHFFKVFNSPYPTPSYSSKDYLWDYVHRLRGKKIAKYADKILAISPDIMNFLPTGTRLLPTAVEVSLIKPQYIKKNPKVKIIHAPSDRLAKGTGKIIEIVQKLSQKYPLEFRLIEGVPRRKALELYSTADIAIDQLLIGWYGRFAVEVMAMGIPAIAYLRKSDLEKFVPFRREIPIINANPENLAEKLSKLIENQAMRIKIGRESRKYVEKFHDSKKLAQETKKLYQKLCAE